jgi:hypothetical protein
MGQLSEYLSIIIGLVTLIGMVGSHYLRQGKQDQINESFWSKFADHEKRFEKNEEKHENLESKIVEIVKEIRVEFKEIQKNQQEAKDSLNSFSHKVEMYMLKMSTEMEKQGDIRNDFNKIFGTENINKLRQDQK